MTNAIEARGLVKRYGETTALAGVDLAVPAGSVLGVLGPNGAGKTTAVRTLATLVRPDEGSARVGGFDVVGQAHQVRRAIGLTGQYASVDENLTGTQNLMLVGRLLGMPKSDARAKAARLLGRFGLDEAGTRQVKGYSGGMRRRLDLAVSLVGDPRILFLDEPTTGLDPHARNDLWHAVGELVADGVTVLLTTQYLEEADRLADRIAVFDAGAVVASGTAAELKSTVGGERLEVRPADPSRVAEAARVLADVTGETPEEHDGLLAVGVPDLNLPPAVLRRLDEAGILVAELTLRRPSLDEVFLSLTGHGAGGAAPGQRDEEVTV
ncbi:ATP-binding cassette domain-containing protein [Phytomonospora endophytica]|uniref:Oleandomycin transport system ATP-binding protein n=1 Tax=Phytomonospora endophytica TaxID=714109 RepID=A0A841FBD5_9ACTN|nr:ATP-binding cassette domain-containing protein [Phytomonospora endophytica]MBB6033566.1 oleandomycin transport system ATP-binding protein [Phytomonospora endophytica]GIG64917.1 daunorubicin resistance protein DrrA family ABC transporter ATP-binding protein [Phytomonospora endophytica]